ncbi:MAG: ABC transporter substrate-binding protein, partial [Dehalococcoidia bacterium]|nr:ABC transporter substrate-binding protein [Dehalococcoidia bacterium]
VTSSLKDTLASVDKVEKVDDYNIKFTLNNSTPYFLEILVAGNMVMYSDEELKANNGDLRRVEIPTGTGPFFFADHAPDERWKLGANPNYFVPGLPYVDGVHVVHAVTWPERGTAVLTGQADYSFNVSRGTWTEGQKRADMSVAETPCLWSHNVAFNNEKPPFDDPRVRKAIHLAVSRQVQIDGYRPVWEPTFVTRWMAVPSPYADSLGAIAQMPGYRPDKTEDIAAAKQLMAEAGYPDGFETEIVTWNGAPTAEVATPLFVGMLKNSLNIDAKIKVIERFTGAEILASGDYELDRGYSFGGSLLDPYLA